MSFRRVEDVVDFVIEELKARGYTIQRYNAHKTNSVYLKLDYGVCNSIRISDHPGIPKYDYLFNVTTTRTAPWERKVERTARYYYNGTPEQLNTLLGHVDRHRMRKLEDLGYRGYIDAIANSKHQNRNAKGFWQYAKVIHKGKVPYISHDELEAMNYGILQW